MSFQYFMFAIFIFTLGTSVSSFLSLVNYRLNTGYSIKSILLGHSECDNCKKQIASANLIPILGWILSKGRCVNCNKDISFTYPLFELILGFTFLLLFITNQSIVSYFIISYLFLLSLSDLEFMEVSATLVNFAVFIGFIYYIISAFIYGFSVVIFFVFIFIILVLFINKVKEIFGLGDLLILLALFFVTNGDLFVNMLFSLVMIAGLWSIFYKYFLHSTNKYIPLIPFISLAYLFALLVPIW